MEVCVDSLSSAIAAAEGGATRIELCSALLEDGLTPSVGLFEVVKSVIKIPIFVMIRPKMLNIYNYSEKEVEEMEYDIKMFKSKKADGFVLGALTSEGLVDENVCKRLLLITAPLPVTFHRAFDLTTDPFYSMEKIISLGFERILTSGQKKTALEGVNLITELIKHSNGRIIIMPGVGICVKNLKVILEKTGAIEFHASAKTQVILKTPNLGEETKVFVTSKVHVKEMVDIYQNYST
uniref:Copper homeostasis protein cutC homolog n=1 Tax=Clastoptera arizonana TaxID=38151 RepID=A0A1B6DWR0_9HEMI